MCIHIDVERSFLSKVQVELPRKMGYSKFVIYHIIAMNNNAFVGIDLGSSNTAASVRLDGDKKELFVIPMNDNGDTLLRSIVEYRVRDDGVVRPTVVPRITLRTMKEGNVVMHMKRIIGRKFESEVVKEFAPMCKAEVQKGPNGFAAFWIPALQRQLLPEEVCAEIIKEVIRRVKKFMEHYPTYKLRGLGVTVPAFFEQEQRIATKKAVQLAIDGIIPEFPNDEFLTSHPEIHLYNEPSAAALTYCHESRETDGYIATYDLGGGTFDATVMKVVNGREYTVISCRGINTIGGTNFDESILNYVVDYFNKEYGEDLLPPRKSKEYYRCLAKLETCCKEAKEELSAVNSTDIELNDYIANAVGKSENDFDQVYEVTLTREIVRNLIQESLQTTFRELQSTIEQANLSCGIIKKVVLVGGSTRLPLVREELEKVFPGRISKEVNVDDCVSKGAALFVYAESRNSIFLQNKTMLNVYTHPAGKKRLEVFIPKGTPIPCKKQKTFWTKKDHIGVVKDELYEGETSETAHKLASLMAKGITEYDDGRAVELLYTISISRECIISYSVEEVESGKLLVKDSVVGYKK